MRLDFRRELEAPASVAWAHLCEPELMNLWSMAKVSLKQAGQNGHPGGPGAHRRVHVQAGGRTWVLDEVIRDSRPPDRLVYQVVDALGLRSHLGTIELESRGEHCALHWQVDFDFSTPGATPLVGRVLRKKLGASLDTLQEILRSQPARPPLPSFSEVPQPSADDWQQAETVLRKQRSLAAELDRAEDPKRVFAHIYSYVSEGILGACKENRFVYPIWALKLLPIFHDYYIRNYRRWIGESEGAVESHWRRAFRVAEQGSSRYPGPEGQLMSGLILSIHAHVESDLPRSLAEVYADHFAESCDYARFRGDYYCMGQVFIDAAAKIQALIPQEYIPLWAKTMRGLLPEELVQVLIYRKTYDLPKQRRAAFRRGAELAEMLVRRERG